MPDKNRFKINNSSKDVQKNIQKNKLTSELSELQTFAEMYPMSCQCMGSPSQE